MKENKRARSGLQEEVEKLLAETQRLKKAKNKYLKTIKELKVSDSELRALVKALPDIIIENTEKELQVLFRLVWENSIMGMRLTDEQGTILMVNNAFCQLVGNNKNELVGKPLSVIYSKEKRFDVEKKHM